MRKDGFEVGGIHHVFSRSISGYRILDREKDQEHMLRLMKFFNMTELPGRFSKFRSSKIVKDYLNLDDAIESMALERKSNVNIVAYCFMPTHIHLVLEELEEGGIVRFVKNTLCSYACFFNKKYNRAGHLWSGRFKNVKVQTEEQLWHLTRYVHLNPVTAYLVEDPINWKGSSYSEYLKTENICKFKNLINMDPKEYKKFTLAQIEEQRERAILKNLTLD